MNHPIYPDCIVKPDNQGRWILYTDSSHQEVVAIFSEKADADAAQGFFSKG